MFCSDAGSILERSRVQKAMKKALKEAKLPHYFTPHCLRHTFASLLLQAGESPVYVQRQLGHASIQLTVDTYGRWLPMENKGAVDRLDEGESKPGGSRMVANGGSTGGGASQAVEKLGAPGVTRTPDLGIRNPSLYPY